MQRLARIVLIISILLALLLGSAGSVASQVGKDALANCKELAFSTEEDFVTQGPEPSDGNPIISDGDLLSPGCVVCARNADLLAETFDVTSDLGLDAVDVIDVDGYLVVFSTELDSPNQGQFTAGDLLVTNGAIIPNQALTSLFGVGYDIGLDAVQFVGNLESIIAFLGAWATAPPSPEALPGMLAEYTIDLWFSTEGTFTPVEGSGFLDGDLLSARDGIIVASNDTFLPNSVPAGIPTRGVDFGLDAVASDRTFEREQLHFSTEILFEGEPSFTDGDVLKLANGVVATNYDLIYCFEPKAKELGLDALSVGIPSTPECTSRITDIGGVDVGDIDPTSGTVYPLTLAGIDAPLPFGGRINIQGTICDDVDQFRVVYRKHGSADPWEPMKVLGSANWKVRADAFIPAGPDCLGKVGWASAADGWYDANDYRHLSEAALGGCNPDLSLTIWESTLAVAGSEELYELVLETKPNVSPPPVISDTLRLVQLDNKPPTVRLNKQPGVCNAYTNDDMPLMVTGRISDTHFYEYQLKISGDGYWPPEYYPEVTFYADPTDNVIETGTINWDNFVELHTVDVHDLVPNPVKCGYTVDLTAWDRTVSCGFTYPSNFATRCVGCRHSGDTWTFEYTPPTP
ncbi:MAG TPA: hypothetical protein VLY63_21770 [Anaerolineae bacterium]|nr:hypothetical protein [Anaerolineae bacterium]